MPWSRLKNCLKVTKAHVIKGTVVTRIKQAFNKSHGELDAEFENHSSASNALPQNRG